MKLFRKFKNSGLFIATTVLLSPVAINYSLSNNNQVLAQNNQLNLISQGNGTLSITGRQNRKINSTSVIVKNNQADITLVFGNNQTMRFGGRFTRQTPQQGRIELTNSGQANASGSLLLEYRNNRIVLLNGQGMLDGQQFSLVFRADKGNSQPDNNSLNIQQRGEGLYDLQSRKPQNVTSVNFSVDARGKARISLTLKNGNVINFEGKQTQRDAYSVRIKISNSGMATATGFFTIDLGSNNSISNIIGQGTVDGQTFLVNFR